MKLTSLGLLMVSFFVHNIFMLGSQILKFFIFSFFICLVFMNSATTNSGDSSDSDVIQHKVSSVFRVVHNLVENEEQDKLFINKTSGFVSSSNSIRRFKRKWHHLRYRVSKLPVRLWNSFGIIKLLFISVLFPQYLCLIFMKYFNFYINSWFLLFLSGLFCQKYSFNFVLLFVDLAPIFLVFSPFQETASLAR